MKSNRFAILSFVLSSASLSAAAQAAPLKGTLLGRVSEVPQTSSATCKTRIRFELDGNVLQVAKLQTQMCLTSADNSDRQYEVRKAESNGVRSFVGQDIQGLGAQIELKIDDAARTVTLTEQAGHTLTQGSGSFEDVIEP